MTKDSEKEPLQPPECDDNSTFKDYLQGIIYAIGYSIFYAIACLMLKNVRNARGQHLRPEETLLPRSLLFILSTCLFMAFKKMSLYGLGTKTYIILNAIGIITTIIIQCYNLAFYSMSVGDAQTICFLAIISTMIFERIFRGTKISVWKAIFSTTVVIGGGLVAQPSLGKSFSENHIGGGNLTVSHPTQDVRYSDNFLRNRMVGLLIIFVGFNLQAVDNIIISIIKDTSPAIIIFYSGLWKLLLLPLSQILLPSPGRLFTAQIYDFLEYDLLYHIAMGLFLLVSWIALVMSLKKISPVVHTVVVMSFSLVFDYGGQTIIDGTVPNTMACIGIGVTSASVTLFLMEEKILRRN